MRLVDIRTTFDGAPMPPLMLGPSSDLTTAEQEQLVVEAIGLLTAAENALTEAQPDDAAKAAGWIARITLLNKVRQEFGQWVTTADAP